VELERLQQIVKLLKEQGLSEITVEEGDARVTVRQDLMSPTAPQISVMPVAPSMEQPVVDDGTFALTAPLVGTFYRRPSPEDDPFIRAGDIVEAGTTVCIIEAMKVMNEIKAERSGRLVRALAEDGDPVEFSQELFVFEKA